MRTRFAHIRHGPKTLPRLRGKVSFQKIFRVFTLIQSDIRHIGKLSKVGKIRRQLWPAKSTRPEVGNVTDNHPRGRSDTCTTAGWHGTCAAMTSDNRCTIQRRLILPRSASGVLRQGRCLPLRSSAICCIELSDITPPPKRRAGPAPATPYRKATLKKRSG